MHINCYIKSKKFSSHQVISHLFDRQPQIMSKSNIKYIQYLRSLLWLCNLFFDRGLLNNINIHLVLNYCSLKGPARLEGPPHGLPAVLEIVKMCCKVVRCGINHREVEDIDLSGIQADLIRFCLFSLLWTSLYQ